MGRLLSPENSTRGSRFRPNWPARSRRRCLRGRRNHHLRGYPGVVAHRGRRTRHVHMGVPQERGRPCRFRSNAGRGPGQNSRPSDAVPVSEGAKKGAGTVPPSEGNEARREGRSGVGALRCTGEAGEHAPADPVEGRECRVREPEEGKMTGTPSPDTISTRLHRIAMLAREMPGVALRTLAQHIGRRRGTVAYVLASLSPARGTLSAPRSHRHPLQLSSCSEPMT